MSFDKKELKKLLDGKELKSTEDIFDLNSNGKYPNKNVGNG